jgi:ATP-dependent Clp protease ATP-binding subunit ClpX
VIVTLNALTADDLVRVLTEPKNAVTRQFQKFLGLDKVELVFTEGALVAAAEVALERKTGARALRSIVEERVGRRSIGFGSDAGVSSAERGKILERLMPEDLLKFGLIPEFIGRLPVIVTLTALTAEDLVRVLTEPKNAVTRQFQKFLGLDKVELVFTDGALRAAADVALERKTGARALRSIVEEALLEVMYDIPERTDVKKVVITGETIEHGQPPMLLTETETETEPRRRGARERAEESA